MTKTLIFTAVLTLSMIACSTKEIKKISVPEVAKNYKTFKRMTNAPVYVNPYIAYQCTRPSKEQIQEAKKEKGPHTMTIVHMYMNEIAAKAFAKKPYSFPVGSVIVKDKINGEKGVGGMIKRKPGYDTKNGDWEYFYFTKLNKIDSGKIPSCIKCHSAQAKNDYVFGGWSDR